MLRGTLGPRESQALYPPPRGVEGAAVHHAGGLPEDTGAGLSFEFAVMSRDAESGGGPSQEVGKAGLSSLRVTHPHDVMV